MSKFYNLDDQVWESGMFKIYPAKRLCELC